MIHYKKRIKYKYNLHCDVTYETGLSVDLPASIGPVAISGTGLLTINSGYSWDGPSGPTIATPTFMKGSLIHDALYQLIREQILPLSDRLRADEILREVCIKSGMARFRAWYVYRAVRLAGESSAKPDMLKAA
jgi:hypothetical protein